MSSPAGLHSTQADLVARWMPSSSRAGVILNLSPDLISSLRQITAVGSSPMGPDDSFASDFAQLPGSVDSSCFSVGGGERTGTDRAVNNLNSAPTHPDGECVTLDEMASKAQDLPLIMKLEQLRKWQKHMQEQLKANQLEELLRLQEEQQRLLGIMNESQHCKKGQAKSTAMSEAKLADDSLRGCFIYSEISHSPRENNNGVQPGSSIGLQQEEHVSPAGRQRHLSEGSRSPRRDDVEQIDDTNCHSELDDTLIQCNAVSISEDNRRKVGETPHDRPIRPGIGGQMQTFEELLEEQLRLEEQRLPAGQHQKSRTGAVQAPPKRTFLKRGEGLSRFANNRKSLPQKTYKDHKPQNQAQLISRSKSEPASFLRVSTSVPQPPIQRKTAILNKENQVKRLCLTSKDVRIESKPERTEVLCNHQEQNPEGSKSVNAGSQSKQHKPPWQEKEQSNRIRELSNQDLHLNLPEQQMCRSGAPAVEKDCEPKGALAADRVDSEAPQDSFALSLKEKLQHWESDQQVESIELGEFELLEQAAEELSFSSNSSFVMKVLQMDRQRQGVNGLHLRRLSSTPIKSPPRCALKRSCSEGSGVGLAHKSISVNAQECEAQIRGDALSIVDKQRHTEEKENNEVIVSDASSCSGSEFGDAEVAETGALSFPAQSIPPYDKHSYEDEDSSRDSTSTSNVGDEDQRDFTLSHTDDSTLIEDPDSQQRRVVFDDDDTWNDMEEETTISTANDITEAVSNRTSPQEKTLVRKVAVSSKVVKPLKDANTQEEKAIPGSQLMIRLFPSLKPKAQNAPLSPPPAAAAAEDKALVEETGRDIHSVQLRQRLAELEIEIERFKKENAALAKLRQESEIKQENLRKERLEFEQMKAEESAKFEEYKKEENRKLQKERKLFEKHAAASRAIPDKKEREEIQVLKQQLSSLQEELRRRESRWSLTNSRLRQQMDSCNQENSALRDEIRMLEKLRLSTWKKNSLTAGDTETKEASGTLETSVPSVTKGVTFASPLDSRRSSSSPTEKNVVAVNRKSSKDAGQPAAAGIKSSLRKPVLLGSSSSFPTKRTEEKSVTLGKSNEKQPQQKAAHSSSPKVSQLKESELIETSEPESAKETITHPDGKVEKVLVNGDRLIVFPNGTRKEVSADGQSLKVTFFNGDTKQVTGDQRVIYFYAEAQTTHITYPDGMEVLHFPNNQTEKHFPDGRKEITFPDQTVKNLFPDGREESVLTDGTIIQVNPDGTKEIHFNTGQKELHTAEFKQRQYPDGTVKTVYADGRQETRYPTGRLRIKDKDGNVLVDNMP
ncbi:centromere protein J [Gouania willdenowi]|uniref:Centromere protein J n=1 Tax=Gouania willdenowi TaxID=441366 RepID=A0A8C5E694_GOUWI|nr:centromere protein J [Gouania willdenowi]